MNLSLRPRQGRHKTNAINRLLRWQSEVTGWQISAAILASVDGAEAYCEDPLCRGRLRYLAAVQLAALAEDVGAGRTPDIKPEPPCSAVVQAEAWLKKELR